MWILLIILLLGGGVVALVIMLNAKREEQDKYYAAARNILKNDFLRTTLENPLKSRSDNNSGGQKLMVYIKTIGIKPQKRYVFNPEREIPFGRQRDESGVFLNEATVSQRHCRMFLYDGYVWLEDLGSSNGTGVKRGAFKNFRLSGGQLTALCSGDVLTIGSTQMKIKLFVFDTTYM